MYIKGRDIHINQKSPNKAFPYIKSRGFLAGFEEDKKYGKWQKVKKNLMEATPQKKPPTMTQQSLALCWKKSEKGLGI